MASSSTSSTTSIPSAAAAVVGATSSTTASVATTATPTVAAPAKVETKAAAPTVAFKPLRFITLPAIKGHTSTVIFIHGLGDSGEGWRDSAEELQESLPHVKFILPHAHNQPVTLNGGMAMPSWHDIKNLSKLEANDGKGLDVSKAALSALIDDEIKAGIPSTRIAIGGFSQGAAMAAITGYQYPAKLAGVCCLSGYLPFVGDYAAAIAAANKLTPALVCHGTADQVVQYQFGQKLFESLKAAGVPAEFKSYRNMPHSACPQELTDVATFLQRVLP